MDSFTFACPDCGQHLEADTDMVGSSVECPTCQSNIAVPQLGATYESSGISDEAPQRQATKQTEVEQAPDLTKPASASARTVSFTPQPFGSAIPLVIYTLGFGWIATWFLPDRFFISIPLVPVVLLAVSSLLLAYVTACRFLRPYPVPVVRIMLACAFTMTVGLLSLLYFQTMADNALHLSLLGHGRATGFVLFFKFFGWTYNAVHEGTFFTRIIGYIFGVGLCEEFTKLLPLFFYVFLEPKLSDEKKLGYRQFLLVGFFSGLGFGIGEALYGYAPWSGNISTDSNILRWFACVPSHGIYTIIDATFLWYLKPTIQEEENTRMKLVGCALATLVVAVVHGVYNSFAAIPFFGFILDALTIALMCRLVVLVPRLMNESIPDPEKAGRLSGFAFLAYVQSLAQGIHPLKKVYVTSAGIIVFTLFFSSSRSHVIQLVERGQIDRKTITALPDSGGGRRVSGTYYADLYGYGHEVGISMTAVLSGRGDTVESAWQFTCENGLNLRVEFATNAEKAAIADGFVDGYLFRPSKYPYHDVNLAGSPLQRRMQEMRSH